MAKMLHKIKLIIGFKLNFFKKSRLILFLNLLPQKIKFNTLIKKK